MINTHVRQTIVRVQPVLAKVGVSGTEVVSKYVTDNEADLYW